MEIEESKSNDQTQFKSSQPAPSTDSNVHATGSAVEDADALFDRLQPPAARPIHALAAGTRALIASDVLLSSPAAFVRELLENALDSGATNVQILIQLGAGGAIEELEIRDNGRGIRKSDKDLIGQAHCTSKIRNFEEIVSASYGVETFGFRGEALYCIAGSCASMIVQSKSAGEPVAWKATWTNGIRGADTSVAQSSSGTTIRINQLYHNRPVRALMAKKEAAQEKLRIQELLRSYAFVHPHVRIICNEPEFTKPAATASLAAGLSGLALFREAVPLVLGHSTGLNQMMEFESATPDGFTVEGLITRFDADRSHKELFRPKIDRVFLYITSTRSLSLPWLTKALVAEWRTLSIKQAHRQAAREKGLDPDNEDELPPDPIIHGSFSGRFPLAVVKLTVPSPESLLDLNRSPDKRDIVVGDETVFRTNMLTATKAALEAAFAKIEEKQQTEWKANQPPQLETELPQPSPMDVDSGVPSSTPPLAQSSNATKVADDDVQILSSPPFTVKLSPSQPSSTGTSARSPATQRPGVDFSAFAQPLAQPQGFTQANNADTPAATRSTPPSPPTSSSSSLAASPGSPGRPSQPSPKRPRVDGDTSVSSSSPSSRQTQISLVDGENASISVAPRVVAMDDSLLQQIQTGFMQHESLASMTADFSRPQFIGLTPKAGLCVMRLPDDPRDDLFPDSSSDLPTLAAFSSFRGEELNMFHQLLATYSIPSVPLDEQIPIDANFPDLSDAERDQLLQDVLGAERLHLEQRVPSGCVTFQQAMHLGGFRLLTSDATPLALVAVPSDSSISITDFLATLRRIWRDECFQRTRMLKVRPTPTTASVGSSSQDATSSWPPSTAWRCEGIRRAILHQANGAAQARQKMHQNALAAPGADPVSIESKAANKIIERLMATVASRLNEVEGINDWEQLACPHSAPITYRITNQKVKKNEA